MAQKSREVGEIGSESREKGDLPPCSPLLIKRVFTSFKMAKLFGVKDSIPGRFRSHVV